jgi:hypothetical protein
VKIYSNLFKAIAVYPILLQSIRIYSNLFACAKLFSFVPPQHHSAMETGLENIGTQVPLPFFLFRSIQIYSDLFESIQIYSDLFAHPKLPLLVPPQLRAAMRTGLENEGSFVYFSSSLDKSIQIYPDLSQSIILYQDLFGSIPIYSAAQQASWNEFFGGPAVPRSWTPRISSGS